jgi:DNA-binding beta-propeller fold protein YncE
MPTATVVGTGAYRYSVDKQWGRRDGGVAAFGLISGIACDSQDRVYVFQRTPDPSVLIFDRDGRRLAQWGQGVFKHPHGIWRSPHDELYLTDRDTHLVTKWTLDGTLLTSWGTPDSPGAPGAPFNQPTNTFVTPDGELYVSDGYGQSRVHRYGADGRLLHSWGVGGTGPGQFNLPHHVYVDPRDRVLVCDRGNRRIQHFDRSGTYVTEWADIDSPQQVHIKDDVIYLCGGHEVTVMTLDRAILSRWGSHGPGEDQFTDSPHSIWVDSHNDVYVSEVVAHNKLQKYTRV